MSNLQSLNTGPLTPKQQSLSDLQSPIRDSFEHFTATQAEYFKDTNVVTSAKHMQKALDALADGVEDEATKKVV